MSGDSIEVRKINFLQEPSSGTFSSYGESAMVSDAQLLGRAVEDRIGCKSHITCAVGDIKVSLVFNENSAPTLREIKSILRDRGGDFVVKRMELETCKRIQVKLGK